MDPVLLCKSTSNGRLFSRRCTQKDISFFYANARSIVSKVDMLHLEVANKAYDVVVLVETHLDSSIADGEIFPANYLVFRRDRMRNGRYGGGVLIAVRDTYLCTCIFLIYCVRVSLFTFKL